MAFDEVLFPTNISQGSQAVPNWQTDIIVIKSGAEITNEDWQDDLWRFNAAFGVREQADYEALLAFFQARRGMSRKFRFEFLGWREAINEPLIVTGASTIQLIKKFSSGGQSYEKNIYKPKASPAVTLRRAAASFTDFTIDTTTGIITLTPADSTAAITAITQANPGVVTAASHGFSNGDIIPLTSIGGMTELNGKLQTLANVTANTFEIEDTSAFTTYTSGGTASKYVQPSEVLDWSGQFDFPVRFGTDSLPASWTAYQVVQLDDIPIVEVRDPT